MTSQKGPLVHVYVLNRENVLYLKPQHIIATTFLLCNTMMVKSLYSIIDSQDVTVKEKLLKKKLTNLVLTFLPC